MLPQHVKLPLEPLLVPSSLLALISISVVLPEDDERLKDLGLLRARRRSKDRPVAGDLSPSENPKTQSVGDVGEGSLGLSVEFLVLGAEEEAEEAKKSEEQVSWYSQKKERRRKASSLSDGVLARLRKGRGHNVGRLAKEEGVRDSGHDSSTVSVSSVGSGWERRAKKTRARSDSERKGWGNREGARREASASPRIRSPALPSNESKLKFYRCEKF